MKHIEEAKELAVVARAPFRIYYEGPAIRVSGKNRVGPFDILPGHADFFSVMSPGEITIETKSDEPPIIFKLTSGIVSVRNNQVALFVNI
jgi:F0F1-type ATP synthase epsilon subunit